MKGLNKRPLSQATVVVKLETSGKIVKKSPEAYILVHFEDCIVRLLANLVYF